MKRAHWSASLTSNPVKQWWIFAWSSMAGAWYAQFYCRILGRWKRVPHVYCLKYRLFRKSLAASLEGFWARWALIYIKGEIENEASSSLREAAAIFVQEYQTPSVIELRIWALSRDKADKVSNWSLSMMIGSLTFGYEYVKLQANLTETLRMAAKNKSVSFLYILWANSLSF